MHLKVIGLKQAFNHTLDFKEIEIFYNRVYLGFIMYLNIL